MDPIQNEAFSIWEKKQPGGASAVLVLSNQNAVGSTVVTLELSEINPRWTRETSVSVRDIAGRRDIGSATGRFVTDPISGHDSRFYLFRPTAAGAD